MTRGQALARRFAFATVAGLFLGLIGPFGSFGAPVAVRIASWTTSFWLGAAILSLALRYAYGVAARTGTPLWFALCAATVAAAIPLAAGVAMLFTLFAGGRPGNVSALEYYLETLAITAPAALGYLAVARMSGELEPPRPASVALPGAVAMTGFVERLPPALGRDLLALSMEDHYVRAHTPRGSDLVLIPLRQAIDELGAVEGRRVHRSWWVARAAVEGARWDGRNLRLLLRGGLEAPVARGAVAELRGAGWPVE